MTALKDPEVDRPHRRCVLGKYGPGGHHLTRALFERNFAAKLRDPQYTADIDPLLAAGHVWPRTTFARLYRRALSRFCPEIRGTVTDDRPCPLRIPNFWRICEAAHIRDAHQGIGSGIDDLANPSGERK
jgi:hypothetical protein